MQWPLDAKYLQFGRRTTFLFGASVFLHRWSVVSPARWGPCATPTSPTSPSFNQNKIVTVSNYIWRAKSWFLFSLPLSYQISCSQCVNILILSLRRWCSRHFPASSTSIPFLSGGMEPDSTPNLFHESVFPVIPLYFVHRRNRAPHKAMHSYNTKTLTNSVKLTRLRTNSSTH